MAFLAFEGLDGSGKSTLIQGLSDEFKRLKVDFIVTREPGGTELGDELRQLLLRVKGEAPVARAEALLYQAGRAQHVEQVIRPALALKRWVLSDRYAASSVAFQTGGRAIDRAKIDWLNDFATGGLQPDLYILLDVPAAESLRRLKARAEETDRFEREASTFHEKVRRTYLELAAAHPATWFTLDASEPAHQILHRLLAFLRDKKWLV